MKKSFKEKLKKGIQGAISIFLALIMVPMMAFSCLFVDMSRAKLAQALVESAADLTLNSALTQYDALLQEYYGLFASSQSIDDFLGTLDDYFVKCIESTGITDRDTVMYYKKALNSITQKGDDADISDLLNILVDTGEFSVSKTTGGSLCNPTLLKSQIVNFMKYRAPINTGLALIQSLQSFKNLNDESELIEDRQAYYKAEEATNTECKNAWTSIDNYNKLECNMDSNFYQKLKNAFDNNNNQNNGSAINKGSYYKRYEKIILAALSYVYVSNNANTVDKLNFSNPIHSRSYNNITFEATASSINSGYQWYYADKNIYSNNKLAGSYNNIGYHITKNNSANTANVQTPSSEDMETAIRTAQQKLKKLNDEANAFRDKALSDGYTNNIRYVYHYVENIAKYTSAAKDFANAMQGLEFTYRWVPKESELENYEIQSGYEVDLYTKDLNVKKLNYDGKNETYQTWYNSLIAQFKGNSGALKKYYDIANNLKTKSETAKSDYNNILNSNNEYVTVDGTQYEPINKALKEISDEIIHYESVLLAASEALSSASTHLDNIYTSVTSGSLKSAKDTWSNKADSMEGKSSTIADQDAAEIATLSKQFKPDDISALKNRIDKIKSNIDKMIGEFDKYKFGSKMLSEIKSYDDLKGALHGVATSSGNVVDPQHGGDNRKPLSIQSINSGSQQTHRNGFKSGEISTDWISVNESNPNLRANILPFYTYLYKNFNSSGDYNKITDVNNNGLKEETDGAKDNFDSKKDEIADNGKDNLKNSESSGSDITGDDRPSVTGAETITSEKMNVDGNSGDDDSKDLTASNADNSAKNAKEGTTMFKDLGGWLAKMGEGMRDNLYLTEYVMDMFSYDVIEKLGNTNSKIDNSTTNPVIKSLTNNPIDAAHNLAYKAEIEYILYGKSNSANVTTAYATIYLIRLAFNLVYAFSNAELRNTALAMATPISAATCGIVPVPLIQAGLLAACAAAESAIDIGMLKSGEKVPLYKNEETWHLSLANAVSTIVGTAAKVGGGIIVDVVDAGSDKLCELLDKTSDELKNTSADVLDNDIGAALNGVIEEQVSVVVNEVTSSITSQLQIAKTENRAVTKEDIVNAVKNEVRNWSSSEDNASGLMAQARDKAVDYILNSNHIDNIVDEMYSATDSVQVAKNIQAKLELIVSETLTKVKDGLNGAIDSAKNAAKDAIKNGAGALKDSINDSLGKFSSGGSDNSTSSGAASFTSFDYRDYLRLFVFIKFMGSGSSIKTLMRVADVIQANMRKTAETLGLEKDMDFLMSNASGYLTLKCKYYVKPMFLAVPLIAKTVNLQTDSNPDGRTLCYEYTYSLTKGY